MRPINTNVHAAIVVALVHRGYPARFDFLSAYCRDLLPAARDRTVQRALTDLCMERVVFSRVDGYVLDAGKFGALLRGQVTGGVSARAAMARVRTELDRAVQRQRKAESKLDRAVQRQRKAESKLPPPMTFAERMKKRREKRKGSGDLRGNMKKV